MKIVSLLKTVSAILGEGHRYSSRGSKDVPLAEGRDTVFPEEDYDNFILETQQNKDGSLLAYHALQLKDV